MAITTEALKSGKALDQVSQAGLRESNCYYCKDPFKERDLIPKELKSRKGQGGDMIYVCKSCYKIVFMKKG